MKANGPQTNIIKTFLDYRKSPLEYFAKAQEKYGELVYFNMMGKKVFLVTHPEHVEHVLAKNAKNYIKGRTTQLLQSLLGNGLITNDDLSWKTHNRIIRKSFTPAQVQNLIPLFIKSTDDMLERWRKKNGVNILQEMHQLSLDIILESLFKESYISKQKEMREDVDFFLNYILYLSRSLNPLKKYLPTKKNVHFKMKLKKWNHLIYQNIHGQAQKKNHSPSELLSFLVNNETLKEMGHKQIRDEIMTLLFAGHETITNTMAWSFIEVAKNPTYFEDLKLLAHKVFIEGKYELLSENNIAKQIINESMRLHPPVWIFMREATNEDKLDGHKIPKGSLILLGSYYTHRNAKYWSDPDSFSPQRFANIINPNSDSKGVKFYPFGHGPRSCIGNHMAYLEGQIILLKIALKYKLQIREQNEIQLQDPGITLRPLNNIQMELISSE